MNSQELFLKGTEIYVEGDEAIRVNFDNAVGCMYVRFGDVYMNFTKISSIPDSETFSPYKDSKLPREQQVGLLFEALLYTSMEAYVLANRVCLNEPVNLITRVRMRNFMCEYLYHKFSRYVRRNDIDVLCDGRNNPPSMQLSGNIRTTILYKPSFGNKTFYPINITRA